MTTSHSSHALNPIPDDDRERLLTLAAEVRRRGLATPAIFLLEAHRPLAGVLQHMLLAVEPVLALGIKESMLSAVKDLMRSQESLDFFLRALERPIHQGEPIHQVEKEC